MPRSVAVFVDIARQYHGVLLTNKAARINYEKYLQKACSNCELHRAIAYGVQINDEAHPFINVLSSLGYETKYRQARIINDRPDIRQTSWAVGICMDVVRNIKFIDTVIIGSNDPELCGLIEWIKEQGVKVIIYSINVNRQLRSMADQYWELDSDILEIKVPENAEVSED